MDSRPQFVEGMRVFKPRENAPSFIRANISINRGELIEWLTAQENDDIRLDIKESKKGTYYAALNTWKKQPSVLDDPRNIAMPEDRSDVSQIPF